MTESNKTTAIDFTGNAKNAALYFDNIIPISAGFLRKDGYKSLGVKGFKDIFPLKMQDKEVFIDYMNIFIELRESVISADIENDTDGTKTDAVWQIFHIKLALFLVHLKLENYKLLYDFNNDSNCNESYDCTSLELALLPLIDTSKSEWEQIVQIRQDKESIRKLQNLRLFFHENYSGKEKNYVEDDLCKRLEDYVSVTKDWGFETITSSIQMLLTSPVTLASVGTSLAMALFGEPLTALATAGTGVGLEIGKMSLHIAKEKKKLSILQRDHPLAYIIDAKKELE